MAQSHDANHAKIRCRTIIEVLGKPKEHVEKTIRGYVQKIKEDTDFVILAEHFSEPADNEDGFVSVFVEMEKPEEMALPAHIVNSLFNDLQARLHQVDMIVKKQANENAFLRRNLRHSIRNLVSVTLAVKPLSLESLSKVTGVEKDQLKPFLDELVSEGKLQNDGDAYSLAGSEASP